MKRFAERNERIVRDYLSGTLMADLAVREGITESRVGQIVRRDAPEDERRQVVREHWRAAATRGIRSSAFAAYNEARKKEQRENARNRAVEAWLDEGFSYTETAQKASAMFYTTSRCAVAGIANRRRARAA